MPEINLLDALETNWLKLGTMEMEANDKRIVIVQDDFVSGYECQTCNKTGEVPCDSCKGSGSSFVVKDAKCSKCEGRKTQVCSECKGAGELLFMPETSKNRPTTGTIVSIGENVTMWKRGECCIYPSFTGNCWDIEAIDIHGRTVRVTIVVMHQHEPLCRVKGHLELRRAKKATALGTAM